MSVDPELRRALIRQHEQRGRLLASAASHVGWKMGMGDRERIGGAVIGYLTTATELQSGECYRGVMGDLHADAEVAVAIGEDGDVVGYGGALELVDLRGNDDAGRIVAENVFHRAFAIGELHAAELPVEVRLLINGTVRAEERSAGSFDDRLLRAQSLLACVGEHLRPGDRIITGSIVQVPVAHEDDVVADFGPLGSVRLGIA